MKKSVMMGRAPLKNIFLLLFVFLFLVWSLFLFDNDNTFVVNGITIPIFKSADIVEKVFDKSLKAGRIIYFLDVGFPADDIVSFYDQEFESMGLIPLTGDFYSARKWQFLNKKTLEYKNVSEPPGHFNASWTDKDGALRVTVALFYGERFDNSHPPKLSVTVGVEPYYELASLEKFFRHLTKAEQLESFSLIIDRYTDKKGRIDLDRALKENPDDRRIEQFATIIRGEKWRQ